MIGDVFSPDDEKAPPTAYLIRRFRKNACEVRRFIMRTREAFG